MSESNHQMPRFTILDGGTGRELARRGAPFRQPEWSALALIEAPEAVRAVHQAYVAAGADIITTNSYALVPFHLGASRFAADGAALAALAGRLAREVADGAGRPVAVAGSLPPVGGSYRPDLFDAAGARAVLSVLVNALAPHVSHWQAETISSLAEAECVAAAVAGAVAGAGRGRPLWLSFTLDDGDPAAPPRLRSGEAVSEAARLAARVGAAAMLFNCSQPEVMAAALAVAKDELPAAISLGAYANAFPPQPADAEANAGLDPIRADLTPDAYARFAGAWLAAGATIIGGCCGVGPEHIAALAAMREALA